MQSVYGIDLDANGRAWLKTRSFRVLETRIAGLLADPRTRLSRALIPQPPALRWT